MYTWHWKFKCFHVSCFFLKRWTFIENMYLFTVSWVTLKQQHSWFKSSNNREATRSNERYWSDISWTSNKLIFDGLPFAHVLKSLYLPYMRCMKSITPQDFWFCFIIFLYISNIFCTLKLMHVSDEKGLCSATTYWRCLKQMKD